ncbi:hypothetical protein K443DRAFT_180374 [Laccaria amethystina LaAM-08-1]|uniref:Restriction endonuclease domain-containing protein n=1 Tax=Laccaria amethystina LaAM-08-1 TaxID=1095629 RepID=A0A0C9XNF5_9AGAR|nr:hypothetical protein K443DRAFT_180374 [Laccaria amethystina LaAM-08-1]
MSVCLVAPDTPSSVIRRAPRPSNEMTHRQAINSLRSYIKDASPTGVHVYCFNVPENDLEAAYSLLDKEEQRRSMRVTYSDDYNFIVRFMPSATHDEASCFWSHSVIAELIALAQNGHHLRTAPGITFSGTRTYQLGAREMQGDAAFRPSNSNSENPSVILEVGCSESLRQLKIDAKLWIEHLPEVQLVIILSIDPPAPDYPNLPRITIELWRGVAPSRPLRGDHARTRNGQMVWHADWTQQAGPLYILLADLFRGQVPQQYGVNNDRIVLDSAGWREAIIKVYR